MELIRKNRGEIFATLGSSVATLALIMAAAPAYAQEGDEIVVTAQKREQSLLDVPAAVSAFSGDKLGELGIQNLPQLTAQVPNFRVTFERGNNSIPNFTLRGVRGVGLASHLNESSVAVYTDEVFQGDETSLNSALFDVQRVEVLRGPQGTVFGKNTTAGLVHFISNKPTREFSGYGNLQYGSDNQVIGEAAVSGPISDRVRFRIAGKFNRDDGHYKNRYLFAGQNGVEKKNADTNIWGVRAMLDIDLTDKTLLRLIGSYGENNSQNTPGIGYGAFLPGTTKQSGYTRADMCTRERILHTTDCISLAQINPGVLPVLGRQIMSGITNQTAKELSIRGRGRSATAILTQDLDWATLTSITNFSKNSYHTSIDGDAGYTISAPIPGSNAQDGIVIYGNTFRQVSEELRLNGSTARFDWVTGGLFYHDRKTNTQQIYLRSNGIGVFTTGALKSKSFALFGQLDAHLSNQFTASVGGRYTYERRTLTNATTFGLFLPSGAPLLPVQNVLAAMKAQGINPGPLTKDFTGKLSLAWKPDDNNNLYASFSRGIKGLGFNTAFSPTNPLAANVAIAGPVKQEVLDAFEVGSKNHLFDRMLTINTAAFYYDFRNKQESLVVFDPTLGTTRTLYVNVGNAVIYGIESEILFKPTSRLDFNLSGGLLHSEHKSSTIIVNSFGERIPLDGLPIAEIPKWSATGYIAYRIPVDGIGQFTVQPEFNTYGKINYSLTHDPLLADDSHMFVNLRIFWESESGRYNAQAFVTNLFEEKSLIRPGDPVLGNQGKFYATEGEGRLWGVKLGVKF